MIAARIMRGVKWSLGLALAHYVCVWLSVLAFLIVMGHIDDQRTAARESVGWALYRAHEVLLQPMGCCFHGEPNWVSHVRILLNSLLWGTAAGTLLLFWRWHRTPRTAATAGNRTRPTQ
jgi:peptidoglycan/LPS O-acetylase OafA/YrhL